MAIRKFSASSLTNPNSKSSKLWDQETTLGTFESIATASCTTTEASVTFSNIPQRSYSSASSYLIRLLFKFLLIFFLFINLLIGEFRPKIFHYEYKNRDLILKSKLIEYFLIYCSS